VGEAPVAGEAVGTGVGVGVDVAPGARLGGALGARGVAAGVALAVADGEMLGLAGLLGASVGALVGAFPLGGTDAPPPLQAASDTAISENAMRSLMATPMSGISADGARLLSLAFDRFRIRAGNHSFAEQ